jgi:hypothetical protein
MSSSTDTMDGDDDTEDADGPRDGARVDRTVAPVSRRVVDVGGERVRRLAVGTDDGQRFAVLVAPAPAPLVFVEPGRRYRLVGLLWSDPPTAADDPEPCPGCGGPLRRGRAVDGVGPVVGRAAGRLGIAEPFGVVDDRTAVERPDEPRSGSSGSSGGGEPVPRRVCDSCGYRVG